MVVNLENCSKFGYFSRKIRVKLDREKIKKVLEMYLYLSVEEKRA